MMSRSLLRLLAVALAAGLMSCSQSEKKPPTYAERVQKMSAMPGFFPLYWDGKAGKLWLEIERFDTDFLYVESLPAGIGSNDIGLDRGQLGQERVVRFTRSGPRVLLVAPNLAFRAVTNDAVERRAVEDSFASSVLAGFEVTAEEGSKVLVDATDFFLRDAHDVIGTLKSTKQGAFTLDAKRSAFFLPRTKNFPRNTEVEVILTFAGTEPGGFVRDVAPDPKSITVRQKHSLVQLPDDHYRPRAFDPRAGYFSMAYADYSSPIGDPLMKRFITRHRLEKKDPAAARSEPVQPIIYYLDPGTPEPVRSALLDGARWWSQAFEAAGFINAFRVEMLPPDADPLDVRYNIIQWVHRATRGWSYGASVADPRTGEIIKGCVTLGSLRVRQDIMIAEGLLAPYEDGKPASPEMERMALARLRQLAAHEVGHTLGLSHNYIASTVGRASVMDYPHPLVNLAPDGTLDLRDAYATGIGEWDKVAITCGYAQFEPGTDETAAIEGLLRAARERGLTYLTDQDARPLGSAHPLVHLWDNGTNAVDELNRMLVVRATALARFGAAVIKPGRPLATIEEPLVTTFLLHRYQLEAAAKSIAGQTYSYALRGDGQTPVTRVAPEEQRRALGAVLDALQPRVLALPESLLAQLPPRPAGFPSTRELFSRHTGLTFDALAPAETAAEITFSLLFNSERAARLVQQSARDPQVPGLDEVIGRALDATWRLPAGADYAGEIQRAVDYVALARLVRLAADSDVAPQVKAVVMQQLTTLRDWLRNAAPKAAAPAQQAHLAEGARLITQFLEHPKDFTPPDVPEPPPGQPIGEMFDCDGAGFLR